MEAKEFAVFADRLKTAFPKDNLLATEDQMDWWFELLEDIPFQTAIMALKKYTIANKFPPSIADIRTWTADLMENRIPEADEAWGELNKAIRKYGYMQEDKALESLSEPVMKTVKRIGYQNICQSPYEQINTLRAQFRGAYEAEYRRTMEVRRMPERMRIEQEAVQQAALPKMEVEDGRSESL